MYTYVNFQPEILNSELVSYHQHTTFHEPCRIFYQKSYTTGSPRIGVVPYLVPVLSHHRQVLLPQRHRSPDLRWNWQSPFFQVNPFLVGQRVDANLTRLHETHFGSSVNSIPCTVVHSPMEVSSLSPQQLNLTPIATIDGRTATEGGRERVRRSVGDTEGSVNGGGHHIDGGARHGDGGARHIQLAKTRLFPLGPAAPIDRMPHVQFRSHPLVTSSSFLIDLLLFRPNGTIFDCELGCFIPLEEYQKRRSKESLASVKEEME